MQAHYIFFWSLAIILPIQLILWHHIPFVDKSMWITHTEHVWRWDDQVFDKSVYGHPGTPTMVVAIILAKFTGQPIASTFLTSLALLISLAIAGVAAVCFMLRPGTWWWLGATGMLLFNRLYIASTPPTALESVLVPGIVFLSWLLWERGRNVDNRLWWTWGILFGLAGATRADFSGFLLLALLCLLVPRFGVKRLLLPLVLAFTTFAAVNPFMWHMPVRHVLDLLHVARFHYTEYDHVKLPWITVALLSPLAVISIVLNIVWLVLSRRLPQKAPALFIGWLLLTSAVFAGLIYYSQFQAHRYFFPLVFLWEALLPLFVISLLPAIRWEWVPDNRQAAAQHVMNATLLIILIGGPAIMLLHLYYLPVVKLFCSFSCRFVE